jgi:hypothetical protein
MLKSVLLAGAVLMIASPALADSACGPNPIAPAIPGASAVAGKTADEAVKIRHEAFVQVKAYQGTLKPFRECLMKQTTDAKAAVEAAKDDSAKKTAQAKMDDLQKAYDKTVDDETQTVNEYGALQTAVCKVADCTPKK